MSTNSNNPVFQQSQSINIGRSGFVMTQQDISGYPNYVGRDWQSYSTSQYSVGLTNRVIFTPNNQDESKELRLTTSFAQLGLPFPVGDYTTQDGGVMDASKQRITITGATFRSNTSGFGNLTDTFTVGGGASYHKFGSTTYNYVDPNQSTTLTRSGLSYSLDPSTGTDTLSNFDFRIRGVQQEKTTNDQFQLTYYITPQLTGTATSYYIGNLFVIDGLDGDVLAPFEYKGHTLTCDADCFVNASPQLDAEFDTTASASNTVGFPAGEVGDYYAGDYVAVGYIEAEPFNGDVSMLQSYSSDGALSALCGLTYGGIFDLLSDFDGTYTGTRIQPGSSFVSTQFTLEKQGNVRYGIDESYSSDFNGVYSGGRIRVGDYDITADFVTTPGAGVFVEQGGNGVIGASSGINIQGGYLKTLGNVAYDSDLTVDVRFDGGTTAGLILEGWNSYPSADFSSTSLAGLLFEQQIELDTDFTQTAQAGYLLQDGAMDVDAAFDIPFLETALVYVTQAFMDVEVTMPDTLAGFGLFGEVDLLADTIKLSAGRLWVVDPYYQLVVPDEYRTIRIVPELRVLEVKNEKRVNIVTTENRTTFVPQETRVIHIPFAPVRRKGNIRLERY